MYKSTLPGQSHVKVVVKKPDEAFTGGATYVSSASVMWLLIRADVVSVSLR